MEVLPIDWYIDTPIDFEHKQFTLYAYLQKVEKVNAADGLIFQTEKQLKEFGEKIPAEKKSVIENALNKLKEVHKQQDLANIEAATKELNDAWMAASQDMYNATQGDQPGAQPSTEQAGAANAENVTDAEFEEVK